MCGRYSITSAPEAIRAVFRYTEEPQFPARYNIAPTQPIPVVRLIDGTRHFVLMRWGLVPSWVKDPANFSLLINARGETVCEKPAFRNAMKYRRCLIPADGFYEWQASGSGPKQPFYIHAKSGPVAFAGLYETWIGPNGEEIDTAAIVTTRANRALGPLHDRMPAVIAPDAFDLWLDCTNVDARTAEALIASAPDDQFEFWPVSTLVNRTANDHVRLIERAVANAAPSGRPGKTERSARPKQVPPDGRQGNLF
jgi:putative SOS response-associated peptidase YedK